MENLEGGFVLRLHNGAVNKRSAYFRYAGSSLEHLIPPYRRKLDRGTGVMSLPNGKNSDDWIIRRRYLRPLCKVMVSVPTTPRKVPEEPSKF